jgi:UDP-N-acetylglucosamine 4,6-dehydratase (inverting)
MIKDKSILVTGGTGSFGNHFVQYIAKHYDPKKIVIYSRDEYKQFHMRERLKEYESKLRFFVGDVRDQDRLCRAFDGIDYCVHAAAMKQVPACEYNPNEAIKTNIHGAMNIVECALNMGVKRVVALSTDKAVNPVNLYGGTKLVSDKLFVAANAYTGNKDVHFSIVRYGNVAGSRGSVIPFFRQLIERGEDELPITDYNMTRFWISLKEGVSLVLKALTGSQGGETFIAKIPSFKVTDLVQALYPNGKMREIGIREGEKLHEVMITKEDAPYTYEYNKHYIIYPHMKWQDHTKIIPGGRLVEAGFEYNSGTNSEWLSVENLRELLKMIKTDLV